MVRITPETPPAVFASYVQAINLAGLLDHTFNGIGYATLNISGKADGCYALALQSDGKIVTVGELNINGAGGPPPTGLFATLRYNTDGTLDHSFGNNLGYVTTSLSGAGYIDGANGVAIQSNGKIVVVGSTNIYDAAPNIGYFGVVRYNSDGSFDTSFGPSKNGIVTKNFSGRIDGATSVVIQPDGKILVGGFTNIYQGGLGTGDATLIRYNSDGTPDNNFGPNGDGTFSINISGVGQVDSIQALLLQPDGKIIAIGGTNVTARGIAIGSFLIMRFSQDGHLDKTFGPSQTGIVTTHISPNVVGYIDEAFAGVLQPDGKIIAAGVVNIDQGGGPVIGYVGLVRYNSDGTIDHAFGQNGIVTTNISGIGYVDGAYSVTLQLDNSIVVAGSTNIWGVGGVGSSILILRYTSEGRLDSSYGPNGTGYTITHISRPPLSDAGHAVALTPSGDIVVVGQTNIDAGFGGAPTAGDFLTLRYINPFTPTTFTSSYGGVGFL